MKEDHVPEHHDPLEPTEFARRLVAALAELDGPEGEQLDELIAWFKRRYPTSLDRLRYARRAYASAIRLRGAARKTPKPGA